MDPQQLLARLKALTSSLSGSQLVTLAASFVLVVSIVVGSAWWVTRPTFALLFADLDAESAAQIVTRLKNAKVPYQLAEGGREIRVPVERLDELRLELASQGLPASGRVGFEIFDRTTFGATEFLEQVNYRRALEGEIARTIATIDEVASARVHIVMGRDSLFGEPRPAKASVVLKLRAQRSLPESAVAGITNLVAASVDGLQPESVVVLDSFGRPLSRTQGDPRDPLGPAQLERQQRIERDMAERVLALLEPVVGPNRVRVNVAVKLNPESRQETEERWDPNAAVVRSRQIQSDQATTGVAVGGVAGARANTPPPAQDEANAPGVQTPLLAATPGSSRSAETTSYEISRTTRHVIQPPGDVARLSVAVIVDDGFTMKTGKDGALQPTRTPRSREELQKIHDIVAAAVGLEPNRGDQLTVENIAFDEPFMADVPPPTLFERYGPQIWEAGRMLSVVVVATLALFVFVRPLMRRLGPAVGAPLTPISAATGTGPQGRPRTVAELESEIEAQFESGKSGRLDSRLPVLTRRAAAISEKEPEHVARLLRSWLLESER